MTCKIRLNRSALILTYTVLQGFPSVDKQAHPHLNQSEAGFQKLQGEQDDKTPANDLKTGLKEQRKTPLIKPFQRKPKSDNTKNSNDHLPDTSPN